ncbi:MAG: hypothetical protein HQM10_09675 [Candidatus Riflebacteria bacterium]|nr:hypothetical protein [Candidatus Riflebacteria bacterium]
MKEILKISGDIFENTSCCHEDREPLQCSCRECCQPTYYGQKESYSCIKKSCYYVMNYGPSYASEIFHFLNMNPFIKNLGKNQVNVLSLGCGFGSDLLAIEKYLVTNLIKGKVDYHGIDIEKNWELLRPPKFSSNFCTADVFHELPKIDLSKYNVIFLNKFFSTLLNIGRHEEFLKLFSEKIKTAWGKNCFVVFNDVNHFKLGRDFFHNHMKTIFQKSYQYYFKLKGAYNNNFEAIEEYKNVFEVPDLLPKSSLPTVTKTVFFLYENVFK